MICASYLNLEILEFVIDLYRQTITENGAGHHNFPLIREHLRSTRSRFYYGEVMPVAD